MTCNDINIRDPFVLEEGGVYYMYGTRAKDFGTGVGGFDVYISTDLVNWSEPRECFNSERYGLNRQVNWAPEVHKFGGAYYMFATFTRENGLRGTYVLKSASPAGEFVPHSIGAVTPEEWECLDGTLYVQDGAPYLVFCHEHTQITDGAVCFVQLSYDLTCAVGEPVTLFYGSQPCWADKKIPEKHFITDGPFMYKTENGTLLMLWSTFIKGNYAQCLVRFKGGRLLAELEHLPPLIADDGGHGMIFKADGRLYLTLHTPNKSGFEHPCFIELEDKGNSLSITNNLS